MTKQEMRIVQLCSYIEQTLGPFCKICCWSDPEVQFWRTSLCYVSPWFIKVHLFLKHCLYNLHFMKTRYLSPNFSNLAPAALTSAEVPCFHKVKYIRLFQKWMNFTSYLKQPDIINATLVLSPSFFGFQKDLNLDLFWSHWMAL